MNKIAVILIRGLVGMKQEVKDTLKMLNLQKKHNCVILDATPVYKGMIEKVKDYVTYGEVTSETIKALEPRRKSEKYFALNPPRGGFERKGIKQPFTKGGVLGDRKEKINDLIAKMI